MRNLFSNTWKTTNWPCLHYCTIFILDVLTRNSCLYCFLGYFSNIIWPDKLSVFLSSFWEIYFFGFCFVFYSQLLKSEIRRLERNQEREKSVANLEYLKNVLLQFIFLKSGSERQRLLPVIDTMLQLSPEEKGKLVAIAQGMLVCFATKLLMEGTHNNICLNISATNSNHCFPAFDTVEKRLFNKSNSTI